MIYNNKETIHVGDKYGRLKVVDKILLGEVGSRHTLWKCTCNCGNVAYVRSYELKNGSVSSCGCLRVEVRMDAFKKMREKVAENYVEGTNLGMLGSQKVQERNKSGVTGVNWEKDRSRWKVYLKIAGKYVLCTHRNNLQEAIALRRAAENLYVKPLLEKYKYGIGQ